MHRDDDDDIIIIPAGPDEAADTTLCAHCRDAAAASARSRMPIDTTDTPTRRLAHLNIYTYASSRAEGKQYYIIRVSLLLLPRTRAYQTTVCAHCVCSSSTTTPRVASARRSGQNAYIPGNNITVRGNEIVCDFFPTKSSVYGIILLLCIPTTAENECAHTTIRDPYTRYMYYNTILN